jgi:hypothetical protein
LTDCGKILDLHVVLLSCYELRVTGKISQSVNMTACQGKSRVVVVVTGDTNLYLSTLIDKVVVSQSLIYSSRELYLPKPKLAAYSAQRYITTATLSLPFSCVSRLALTEGAFHLVYPEPPTDHAGFGLASGPLAPSPNRCPERCGRTCK